MKVFADANFFTNWLVRLPFTEHTEHLLRRQRQTGSRPICVTRLVRQEVLNALHRLVFESRHSSHDFSVGHGAAVMAEAYFESKLDEQEAFQAVEPDPDILDRQYFDLVHRHTATHGFRTNDVLHVASALVLGCDTFWSFDARAKKLARLEGLKVN